jgi:hypothetical protein
MSNQINIQNLYVNGLSQNANIDIGNNLQNSHTANLKLNGANFSMGDFSPAKSLILSKNQDSDISDQDQIDNPSTPEQG